MRILVIENNSLQLAAIIHDLKQIYPNAHIHPPPERSINGTDEAQELLKEFLESDTSETVVMLDLDLVAKEGGQIQSGISLAPWIRAHFPTAVIVVFSIWWDRVRQRDDRKSLFDGAIDKTKLDPDKNEERLLLIKQGIQDAILHSKARRGVGTESSFLLLDSLGTRIIQIALGHDVFLSILNRVAPDWTDRTIKALTTGHSGAFIIEISGSENGNPKQIIVKCARDRATIEREIAAPTDHLDDLGPLGRVMAQHEKEVSRLPEDRGFFYRQCVIKGKTLLAVLAADGTLSSKRKHLNSLLKLQVECCKEAKGKATAHETFPLTSVDIGRAQDSLSKLNEFGELLQQIKQWPAGEDDVGLHINQIRRMIENWNSATQNIELLTVGQHGDLNPGNVIFSSPNDFCLIDFSRLGRWPVGYDIARLATQLRVRLIDGVSGRDWIVNNIESWLEFSFGCPSKVDTTYDGPDVYSRLCDHSMNEVIQRNSLEDLSKILLGYQLGTLWDLTKVLSYTDLSPYKRLYALISMTKVLRDDSLQERLL